MAGEPIDEADGDGGGGGGARGDRKGGEAALVGVVRGRLWALSGELEDFQLYFAQAISLLSLNTGER